MTHPEATQSSLRPEPSHGIAYAQARAAARGFVDSYRARAKQYPSMCIRCHAMEWQGRWRWDEPVPDLAPVVCPACERIRDRDPAHMVVLCGDLPRHWSEVKELIDRVGRVEVAANPLERVMDLEEQADRVLVPTTGVHLARQLVAAIVRRFRHGVRLRFGTRATTIEWMPEA